MQAQSRTAFRVLRRHYRVLPQRLVDVFPVPFPRRPVICAGQNHWQHRRACCASGTGRLSSEEGVCLAARSRGRGEPRPVGRVDQNVRRWCRTLGWSVSRSSRSARRSVRRPSDLRASSRRTSRLLCRGGGAARVSPANPHRSVDGRADRRRSVGQPHETPRDFARAAFCRRSDVGCSSRAIRGLPPTSSPAEAGPRAEDTQRDHDDTFPGVRFLSAYETR